MAYKPKAAANGAAKLFAEGVKETVPFPIRFFNVCVLIFLDLCLFHCDAKMRFAEGGQRKT